jgi:hypothetical protein
MCEEFFESQEESGNGTGSEHAFSLSNLGVDNISGKEK